MKKAIFLSLLLALVLSPLVTFGAFDMNLKYGSKGESVSELQDFLQDQGLYSGKIDGKFGLGTRKAVMAFQSTNNLRADGFFGPISRTKANSALALAIAASDAQEQDETGEIKAPVKQVSPDTQALISKVEELNAKLEAQTKIQEKIVQNTTPPVDVCFNIKDVQTTVPKGMELKEDVCAYPEPIVIVPAEVCTNDTDTNSGPDHVIRTGDIEVSMGTTYGTGVIKMPDTFANDNWHSYGMGYNISASKKVLFENIGVGTYPIIATITYYNTPATKKTTEKSFTVLIKDCE